LVLRQPAEGRQGEPPWPQRTAEKACATTPSWSSGGLGAAPPAQ